MPIVRTSGDKGKPHSSEKGRRAESQRAYIRQHGERKPRRKTLAVTDKYKKVRRVLKSHGGGVGIQTHGNKLAKALNTQRPDQSLFQNSDGYLTGGIKIRS